ncbi:MAG: hypothetical protein HYR74_07895 [Candidatus Eisenbacteria bacterium]|nr:hypothetical protein [Candidatus Eisenbacteria bacterium]
MRLELLRPSRTALGAALPGLLLAFALTAPAAADEGHTARTLKGSWAVGGRTVRIDLPPGRIAIEPSPDARLTAELDVRCAFGNDCEERAAELELETGREESAFRLGVRGMPAVNTRGLSLRGRILVPRGAAVEIDMGAGEISVRGVDGDLDVNVGAGEVSVRMPERAVRSVRMSVGIGEASLAVAGRDIESHGWLGHRVRWGDGSGRSRVNVSLGVGEANVSVD